MVAHRNFTLSGLLVLALAACAGPPPAVTGATARGTAPPSGSMTAAGSSTAAPVTPPTGATTPPAAPVGAGPEVPAARVFLDPVTGQARKPTRAEVEAHNAAQRLRAETAGGQAASEGGQREHFVLPDGTEGVKLAPSDRHAVVVCRQADGSFAENCPPAAGAGRP